MANKKFNPYPILLKPVLKEIVWGGRKMEKLLNKKIPKNKIVGESWEVSNIPGSSSIIRNGEYMNKPLDYVFKKYPEELLGSDKYDQFPLLVKFIDSNDDLSVQVHPNDTYAGKNENGKLGKTECWYVIDAKKDARIVFGLKNVKGKRDLKKIINDGKIKKHLRYMKVKKGDFIFVASGSVHALMSGIVIAEIQQSSDITYRLYDWDRLFDGKPRELHVEKSLDVIDFKSAPAQLIHTDKEDFEVLTDSKYFKVEKLNTKDELEFIKNSLFRIFTIIKGKAKIKYRDIVSGKLKAVNLKSGDNVIIPAALDEFKLTPETKLEALMTQMPRVC